jgi:hypothetical protein
MLLPWSLALCTFDLLPFSLRETSTGERVFVDSARRMRHFYGAAAIVKGPPWVPHTAAYSDDISLVDGDFATMAEYGLNVLRLGAMWPGIEPTRGQYNPSYLDQLETIVSSAARHGIYTLLDGHQDALSEHFVDICAARTRDRPCSGYCRARAGRYSLCPAAPHASLLMPLLRPVPRC